MTENIFLNQPVGDHVCDIDCWDNFYVVGDAFSDHILVCRNRGDCDGVDSTIIYITLGDLVKTARDHCREYHQ